MTHGPGGHPAIGLDAIRAAALAVEAVGDPASHPRVDKGAAGPATVADLASQAAATLCLRRALGPGVRIVAEESLEELERHGGASLLAPVAAAVRAAGVECTEAEVREALAAGGDAGGDGTHWAIDPLDGTKGYLRGGQFAIAIALVDGGHPRVGLLGLPRLGAHGHGAGAGVIVGAIAGQGAWQTPVHEWAPTPIACQDWSPGCRVRVAGSVEAGHSAGDALEHAAAVAGPVDPVRVDSQAKYALVARGDADAYMRLSPTAGYSECTWDHAAGALVAAEAGCTVTDARGIPLDFGAGRRLFGASGILCAPPRLHPLLVDAVRPLLR
jgi:3'(2'), 5'-bisphosphate nucleotidase